MKVFLLMELLVVTAAGWLRGPCIQTENPPPGKIITPPPEDIATVPGEYIQIPCLALGTTLDNLCNFWNITLPEHSEVLSIHDNSSDLYHLDVYQTNSINCTFNNQLIIVNVSPELHGAVLTCIEGIEVRGIEWIVTLDTSSATLSVFDYPEVLNISVLPGKTDIKPGDNVTLQCQLKAAPLVYTVVMWLHNGSSVDKRKHFETEKGVNILSILKIANFTQKDGGNYTCFCLYDRSKVKTSKNITSNTVSVMVYGEDKDGIKIHSKHWKLLATLIGVIFLICSVILYTTYKIRKWNKQRGQSANNEDNVSESEASQEGNGTPPHLPVMEGSSAANERTSLLSSRSINDEQLHLTESNQGQLMQKVRPEPHHIVQIPIRD